MSVWEALAACAMAMLGALVQGTIGFGLALVAAPVLLLLDPSLVPGPLTLSGVPLLLLTGWRERHVLELRGLHWPVAGQLGGTLAAIALLSLAPAGWISLVLGGLVLLAVLLSWWGLRVQPNKRNLFLAGSLAGFMGTTASISGPPLALIHQHVPGPRLRATLTPFFLVGSSFSLTALALAGRLGRSEIEAACVLLPGVLIGFAASNWAAARIDKGAVRRSVLLLSALAAAGVIYRSL